MSYINSMGLIEYGAKGDKNIQGCKIKISAGSSLRAVFLLTVNIGASCLTIYVETVITNCLLI